VQIIPVSLGRRVYGRYIEVVNGGYNYFFQPRNIAGRHHTRWGPRINLSKRSLPCPANRQIRT